MSAPEPMAYVGLCAHGKVRYAVVDEPAHKSDTAKCCGEIVRYGLTLERWTCAAVRVADWGCTPCDAERRDRRSGKLARRRAQPELAL